MIHGNVFSVEKTPLQLTHFSNTNNETKQTFVQSRLFSKHHQRFYFQLKIIYVTDNTGVLNPGFHVVVKEFDPNSTFYNEVPADLMEIDDALYYHSAQPIKTEKFADATKEQIELVLSQAPPLCIEPEVCTVSNEPSLNTRQNHSMFENLHRKSLPSAILLVSHFRLPLRKKYALAMLMSQNKLRLIL